ncbi:MAG: hybrid sensor histidine kinase/response regulator [Campylobacterota bacterium]|nr:hybrid sensor histidine kinase/response regulator [Campylobacterota bacterium]
MYSAKELMTYTKDINVLYVEDDLTVQEMTRDVLSDFFNVVDCADDGEKGLEAYNDYFKENHTNYDLVITDINMPNKNGIEMINDIKALHVDQEIVVISAYNDSENLLNLINKGINTFILKPIGFEQLISSLYKSCETVVIKKQKQQFLINQSKLASMGEMVDMIAHQWLSHVNVLKLHSMTFGSELDSETIKKDVVNEFLEKQEINLDHLTQTLNEFRGFFRNNIDLQSINLKDVILGVKLLMNDLLIKNMIDVDIDIDENLMVNIVPNEFKHVLINLIQNSLEAFNYKEIKERKIVINGYKKDEKTVVELIDNAGGIDESLLNILFEPNITTKSSGTGMGLYLSQLVVNKIGAEMYVKNYNDGVVFSIVLL